MPRVPSWFRAIKQRCMNPNNTNYPKYGGRGIEYKLTTYKDLIKYLGEKPQGYTLDRINNDGHYELSNLRWATYKEQAANRRPAAMREDNQVGITGISVEQPSGRRKKLHYLVQVTIDGKRTKLYNGISLDLAKQALVGHVT